MNTSVDRTTRQDYGSEKKEGGYSLPWLTTILLHGSYPLRGWTDNLPTIVTDTYALTIRFESYEYRGEFYLVGEGYGTPGDILQHVAADHILRIDATSRTEEYLLSVLNAGINVGKAEYEQLDADIECSIHVDVYYQRFAFWTGERTVKIGRNPTENQLNTLAEDLRAEEKG